MSVRLKKLFAGVIIVLQYFIPAILAFCVFGLVEYFIIEKHFPNLYHSLGSWSFILVVGLLMPPFYMFLRPSLKIGRRIIIKLLKSGENDTSDNLSIIVDIFNNNDFHDGDTGHSGH